MIQLLNTGDAMTEKSPELLTEEEWRARDDLRKYWGAFCDADIIPVCREDFTDRLEKFDLIEWRDVTEKDVESTVFAYELGLEVGGHCWDLTAKGEQVYRRGGDRSSEPESDAASLKQT